MDGVGNLMSDKPEVIIDEHGREYIIAERGDDYVIFKDIQGRRYITTKLSGNVPKGFFSKPKEDFDFSKPHDIDVRDIDPAFLKNTNQNEEWFKKPTQFKHFKARIDLLDSKNNDFHTELKYKVLNLIPTINKELEAQIYRYLNDKYGKKKLEAIIRRCVRYRLKQEGKIV